MKLEQEQQPSIVLPFFTFHFSLLVLYCLVAADMHAAEKLPEGDGIAAKYPGDAGIEKLASVIFADDFEGHADLAAAAKKWDVISRNPNVRIAREKNNVYLGNQSVEFGVPKDQRLASVFAKLLTNKRNLLFVRCYSKYAANYDLWGNHNGVSISAGYYVNGIRATAGVRADGKNKYLAAYECYRSREQLDIPNPGKLAVYMYHPEQRHRWGDYFFPTGIVLPNSSRRFNFGPDFVSRKDVVPELDRWYCHELMLKANTAGKRDGRIAFWLDGKLIADFQNLRLRDVDSLKIDRFNVGLHVGPIEHEATKKWYDNVVAATSYIGPVKHVASSK